MAIKNIYFHVFVLNKELYLNSISGGINAIKVWTEHLNKDKYNCFIRTNLDLNMKEFLLSDLIIICHARGFFEPIQQLCLTLKKPYATIPFFEDQNLYWSISKHFDITIANIIASKNPYKELDNLKIEELTKSPYETITNNNVNKPVFERALFNLTNSKLEARNLKKLAPKCTTETIQLSCGIVQKEYYEQNCEFIQKTGLKKGEYILQIGRIDRRKNQLATVLGSRNHSAPLVFIFSQYMPEHLDLLILAIKTFRKSKKTIFITNKLPNYSNSYLNVINISEDMNDNFLISAYQHAAVHVHPSFYEVPGYVFLEAAKLSIPLVASSWGCLKDYFTNKNGIYTLDKRISYCLPYDIRTLEKKINQQFGQSYPKIAHPTFSKTNHQVCMQMQAVLDKYLK